MSHATDLLGSVFQIIWINVLLSGDNAVVIALTYRNLDRRHRRLAIVFGCLAAIGLRIACTVGITALLGLPFLRLIGGVLLLWIALKLIAGDDDPEVQAAGSLWSAVRAIAVADVVMSLDNVFAVTAAAHGSMPLTIFGVAASLPLVVVGSTVILSMLKRVPLLVTAGGALLDGVAGEMIASEPQIAAVLRTFPGWNATWAASAGASCIAAAALFRFAAAGLQRRQGIAAIGIGPN